MIFFSEVILFYIGKLRSVSVEKKFKMHLDWLFFPAFDWRTEQPFCKDVLWLELQYQFLLTITSQTRLTLYRKMPNDRFQVFFINVTANTCQMLLKQNKTSGTISSMKNLFDNFFAHTNVMPLCPIRKVSGLLREFYLRPWNSYILPGPLSCAGLRQGWTNIPSIHPPQLLQIRYIYDVQNQKTDDFWGGN